MGAGQHSLRSVQGDARKRLPDGDSLFGSVENAPASGFSEESSACSGPHEPAGGGTETHRGSVRGSERIVLPVRASKTRRRDQRPQEGDAPRARKRSYVREADGGHDSGDYEEEAVSGTSSATGEGRPSSVRPSSESGSGRPIRESSEEKARSICFLDGERVCSASCTAFTDSPNTPCLILKAFLPPLSARRVAPTYPPPPKVEIPT